MNLQKVGVALLAVAASGLLGQEPPIPIRVRFEFGPSLPPDPVVQDKLCGFLAANLKDEFKVWNFQKAPVGATFPLVTFRILRNGPDWDLSMVFEAAAAAGRDSWTTKLFRGDDLIRMGGLPHGAPQWEPELDRTLTQLLADLKRDEVFKAFRTKVPLGDRVEFPQDLAGDAVRAFLLVPQNNFADFAAYQFKIESRLPSQQATETVTLLSVGLGAYEPTHQGIPVVVQWWVSPVRGKVEVRNVVSHIPELTSFRFFLGEPFNPELSIAPGVGQ